MPSEWQIIIRFGLFLTISLSGASSFATQALECALIFSKSPGNSLKLGSKESLHLEKKILIESMKIKSVFDLKTNNVPEGMRIKLRLGESIEVGSSKYIVIQRTLESKEKQNPLSKYPYALYPAIAIIGNNQSIKIVMEQGSATSHYNNWMEFAKKWKKESQIGETVSVDEWRYSIREYIENLPPNRKYLKHNIGVSDAQWDMFFLNYTKLDNGKGMIRFQTSLFFNLMKTQDVPMQLFTSKFLLYGTIMVNSRKEIEAIIPDRSFGYEDIVGMYSDFANHAKYAHLVKNIKSEGIDLFDGQSKPIALEDNSARYSSNSAISSVSSPTVLIKYGKILSASERNDNDHIPLDWVKTEGPSFLFIMLGGPDAVTELKRQSRPGRMQHFKGFYAEDVLSIEKH